MLKTAPADGRLAQAGGPAPARARKRQNAHRLTPGEAWREHGLVFASTVGTPIEARNINRRWDELRRRLIGDISGTFELSELDAEDEDDQAPA